MAYSYKALKSFRLQNRLRQVEVAKASNISGSLISQIENGWQKITPRVARKIVNGYRKLGVNASSVIFQLAKGHDPITANSS